MLTKPLDLDFEKLKSDWLEICYQKISRLFGALWPATCFVS